MFDNLKADFNRLITNGEGTKLRRMIRGILAQGFQAICVYRFVRWCKNKHIPITPLRFIMERYIEITTGISIPAEAKIGKGLLIHHFGGIVLHSNVVMGENCTLNYNVTIGTKSHSDKAPKIGNNVEIGVGARVLGDITIGNNCQIGANAVVVKSVPDNCVVAGVPANIIKKRG